MQALDEPVYFFQLAPQDASHRVSATNATKLCVPVALINHVKLAGQVCTVPVQLTEQCPRLRFGHVVVHESDRLITP